MYIYIFFVHFSSVNALHTECYVRLPHGTTHFRGSHTFIYVVCCMGICLQPSHTSRKSYMKNECIIYIYYIPISIFMYINLLLFRALCVHSIINERWVAFSCICTHLNNMWICNIQICIFSTCLLAYFGCWCVPYTEHGLHKTGINNSKCPQQTWIL